LRRVIQNELEDRLAEGILSQSIQPHSKVIVDADGDQFKLIPVSLDAEMAALPAGPAGALPAPDAEGGEKVEA
jgi:hypothetical protein